MLKYLTTYMQCALVAGAVSVLVVANAKDQGFRQSLLDYIDDNALTEETQLRIVEPSESSSINDTYDNFSYRPGDWEDYVISSQYKASDGSEKRLSLYEGDDIRINTYGSLGLNLVYGTSMFTRKRYQEYDEDKAVSQVIPGGFNPTQDLQIHVEGGIGDRMTIYIDHDSKKTDNHYMFKYKAVGDEELIREINAGEIDINFQGSKYAVYDNNTAKGLGVDLTLQRKGFMLKAFGSVTRGNTEVEVFRGNSTPGNIKLSEYQFVRGVYYQVEPDKRYNNVLEPPYPPNYTLQAVNLNPYGFELYVDDQNPYNNQNAVQLPVYGGYYTKAQSGVDYRINYTTGLIQFLKPVPDNARVFAVYNLLGASEDPSALLPTDARHPGGMFSGKIFLFLKYGYSLDNDPVPPPNHPAPDKYEVRSFYTIGERYVLPDNFSVVFFMENGVMTQNEISSLGPYTVDYTNGVIQFTYREPFRQLLEAGGTASIIYTERQPDNVYDYSRYKIKIDYFREARSFQLNHLNVIPDSVVIKIDGRVVPASLYTVDYTAGYITFNSPNNPLIGSDTSIEVRYEYLPSLAQEQEFVGGFRTEYAFSRDLKVGGSLLYSRSSGDEKIPTVESEPTQTIFFEGDTTLSLDGRRLAQFFNIFTREKRKAVPLEINGYAEYAKSYKTVNTFGKALVDNMEAAEDVIVMSMNDRDWIPASQPDWAPWATARGILNYYYYRDPGNPAMLKGLIYAAPKIDYSIKTGPYNVATGHVVDSIVAQASQRSLVLDFADNPSAGSGDYASIVTRGLGRDAIDLSGVEYVELSYYYVGSTDVELHLDVGQADEDADGDGMYDTEDVNRNGIIDNDPNTGITEDIGYVFNETGHPATRVGGGPGLNRITRGDGVLTSEDRNGNGMLDTADNVYPFPDPVPLLASERTWQVKRIYLDHSVLTQSQINILKSVVSVRLTVRKNSGAAGKVYIDGINFVSPKWRDLRAGDDTASPDQIKVTAINNIEDREYRLEAFSLVMRDVYKAMYGVQNNNDLLKERETALKVEYDVGGAYASVSATRRFTKPMDFRNYKTLTAWVNFRGFVANDQIGILIGSSDNDYIIYRMKMQFPRVWREMKMCLQKGSGGFVLPAEMAGRPDLKRVTVMKIIAYSAAPPSVGSFWVDEIYLEEPEVVEDSAHWYEGEIKVTKPFYRTKGGVPVMSDFRVKYINRGHGADFSTIGKPDQDIAEEYNQVFSSFTVLPNWNVKLDYIKEDSETDSLNEEVEESRRGETNKNSVVFATDYTSDISGVPSIGITYKYDDYNNTITEQISSYDVTRNKTQTNHAPVIHYRQIIDRFLWGKVTAELYLDMLFKKEKINRKSYEVTVKDLASLASLLEIEKRQRTDARFSIDYLHRYFYVRPAFQVGSEEVVSWLGKSGVNSTEILCNLNGDFHFPFVYNKNCKFVERTKVFALSAGLSDFTYIAPGYKVDIQYFENNFHDYDLLKEPLRGYKRGKDARTLLGTGIDIPVYLHKVKALKFFRTLSLSYNRSLYFTEKNVPYEGERHDPLKERFGMSRTVPGQANAAFNIFKYYPFCFFLGRKNYARGRDYVHTTMNLPVLYANGKVTEDYENTLRLLDNFAANWQVDLGKITVTSIGGLNQVCERQSVYGVPNQVVTANFDLAVTYDLMKLMGFWFFRPNKEGLPYHAAFMTTGYKFETNMLITQNIEEQVHTPTAGLSFKRDRASLSFEFGVNLRKRHSKPYISLNLLKRSYKDQVYIDNMAQYVLFKKTDTGYSFNIFFQTDVQWIFKIFSRFYRLAAFPIYTLEYTMKLNRYDYALTVSPEPYDLHLIASKLTLDLHKNVQGGFSSRFAVEQYRNRYTGNVRKEIFSVEVGAHFTLLF